MRIENHLQDSTLAANGSLSATEWRDFQEVCRTQMEQSGEQGVIAARMLDIGVRLQALSEKVGAAIDRYGS